MDGCLRTKWLDQFRTLLKKENLMRKIVMAVAILGLMCNGCAWLGFGDDSEASTTTTPAQNPETKAEEPTQAPEEVKSEPVKKGKKTTAKTAKKGAKTEAQIKAELDQKGHQLAAQSARTLMPNKAHKEVKKVGDQWVATYVEVNPNNVTTELRPGSSAGLYVGFIRYQEHVMECRGATREAALKASCAQVRTRNLNELIHYDGRQWQD